MKKNTLQGYALKKVGLTMPIRKLPIAILTSFSIFGLAIADEEITYNDASELNDRLSYLNQSITDLSTTDTGLSTAIDNSETSYTLDGNGVDLKIYIYSDLEIDGDNYVLGNTQESYSTPVITLKSGTLSIENLGITHSAVETSSMGISLESGTTLSSLKNVLMYDINQIDWGGNGYGIGLQVYGATVEDISYCGFDNIGITMSASVSQYGGAIATTYYGTINKIEYTYFTDNYIIWTASSSNCGVGGAAIANCVGSTISTIDTCYFDGNYINSNAYAWGGAICNYY